MADAMLQSNLPFPVRRGKVRDVYDLGEQLLIVASDRISAFDCVMPNGIPDKGKILTSLALYWFRKYECEFEHHVISANVREYPPALREFREQIEGRSMLVKKVSVVPIECVARGYLAGSGWKDYIATGQVCGIELPPGLRQCEKLPAAIFTPATKEQTGHDQNIDYDRMIRIIGAGRGDVLRERTLRLYSEAADYAASRGVIIADTKFEFGQLPDGKLILIDEIITPDSSRFWPADKYEPGRDQESFDKQFVRNWLERQPWNKTAPAPRLPDDVVAGTRARYMAAYERLTGESWPNS